MGTWIQEYLSALEVRDEHERAGRATIDAYTRLADRTAALEEAKAANINDIHPTSSTDLQSSSPKSAVGPSRVRAATPVDRAASASPTATSGTVSDLARLRIDLSMAQKGKASLEAQLAAITAELAALKATVSSDTKAAATILRQKTQLEMKLRDRDSELREKARLIENVQDEMVGLQLELNMAEEKTLEFQRENKELVDRWMKRMGQEAEQMNNEYEWK